MGSFTRILSYLVLLAAFAIAGLLLQNWLHRQAGVQLRVLNQSAIETKQHQFTRALEARRYVAPATFTDFDAVADSLDLTLTPKPASGEWPASTSEPTLLSFEHTLPDATIARVSFAPPAAARLLAVYQRVTFGLIVLAPALFGLGLLLASLARNAKEDRPSRPPWNAAKAEAAGMEQFARLSHERTQALELEQRARHRVEQDLQVNRSLLDRSLEERIRLGRELHDNICQTLYAVCLTLESVQKKNTLAPELQGRVDQCLGELRRINQEVRHYLQELDPGKVHENSFRDALQAVVNSFSIYDSVAFETRLNDDAVAQLPAGQVAEIMNIVREAVSNGVRHGGATKITLLAAANAGALAISVQDNGRGFTPRTEGGTDRDGGHGLGNMQTRARQLGGELHLDSTVGKGTRVVLTLPVNAFSSA